MTENPSPGDLLISRIEKLVGTSLQLYKLKAIDKISDVVSSLVVWGTLVTVAALFFVNLNIGIALLIGYLIGKTWLGFVILALFYLLIGLLIYVFRNQWIKNPVKDSVIIQLTDEGDLEEFLTE